MGKSLGGCVEAAKHFGIAGSCCCTSCHEDRDYGYFDLIEHEIDNGDYFSVCCSISNLIDEKMSEQMEKKE